MENDVNLCEWFKEPILNLSDKLIFPDITKKFRENQSFLKHKYINGKITRHRNKYELPGLIPIKKIDIPEKLKKIDDSYEKSKLKILENKELDDKKKATKIKTLKTKTEKKKDNVNKICKARKIQLQLSTKQKNIIDKWIKKCDDLYNYCVSLYNKNSKDFNLTYTKQKIIVFEKFFKDRKK